MIDPSRVAAILREVAEEIILPRHRRLAADDIREKHPGDYVTIADTEAEQALTRRLGALLPGASAVGEEAVAADPAVLDRLSGDGPVWILDPIDGTGNFVKGRTKFAVIVALVVEGRTLHGWIHDPLGERTAIAEAGSGAWIDGRRLSIAAAGPLAAMVGSAGYRRTERLAGTVQHLIRQGSTAHDYLGLLDNTIQFAYFRRLHPWDHAAGVLLHAEAGGYGALLSGRPYRPLPGERDMLLAPDRDSWSRLVPLLAR